MFIKICVGLAVYDGKVPQLVSESLRALETYNNSHSKKIPRAFVFEQVTVTGTSSFFGRNLAASKGILKIKQNLPYDYYLSIDGDIVFTVNSIIRLVEKYRELKKKRFQSLPIGILGGAYAGRSEKNSHKLVAGYFTETKGDAPIEKYLDYDCMDCKEVDWCGTGFMLIPKDVLESLEYPWFRPHIIVKKDEASLSTEDISICMDVKEKLRRSIWVDCSNRVSHLIH
jgi:hypothetical protein